MDFDTDRFLKITHELYNRMTHAGLTATAASEKALGEPDEVLRWDRVLKEFLFLYCLLINLRAFRILGPDRGVQFRAALRAVLAHAVAKMIVEFNPQHADTPREQLESGASAEMDCIELEYGLAAPRPETNQSWVWAVAGKRIADVLGRPSIVGPAATIAEAQWQTIGADELLAGLI